MIGLLILFIVAMFGQALTIGVKDNEQRIEKEEVIECKYLF